MILLLQFGKLYLVASGIILEVAPGIDIDKDIISRMGFLVASIKEMDKRIFNNGKMNIKDEVMQIFEM